MTPIKLRILLKSPSTDEVQTITAAQKRHSCLDNETSTLPDNNVKQTVVKSQIRGLAKQLSKDEHVTNWNLPSAPSQPDLLLNNDLDVADDHGVTSRESSQRFTPIRLISDD
jgi:hypothetical protein